MRGWRVESVPMPKSRKHQEAKLKFSIAHGAVYEAAEALADNPTPEGVERVTSAVAAKRTALTALVVIELEETGDIPRAAATTALVAAAAIG